MDGPSVGFAAGFKDGDPVGVSVRSISIDVARIALGFWVGRDVGIFVLGEWLDFTVGVCAAGNGATGGSVVGA
jgi:hypothetical protein